jgi:tRNA-dihydrouridine synthase B
MNNFWGKLKIPIIGLSPMDGVTDEPMRQIQLSIAKPDVLYTEFVQVEGYSRKPKVFQNILTYKENEHPIVTQVVGCTPSDFAKSIKEIMEMGFDGIDLNMGCPNKDVVQRGAGGALIGNFKLAEEIIKTSLKTIDGKLPLSVKTRIGIDKPVTKEWITFLSQFPLSEVTIHGRLVKQVHSGPVNWQEIKIGAEILKAKGIICLGNGGIKNRKEGEEKCQEYNLDGVLIGQAAIGNPWVFREDYKPTQDEILNTILKHGKLANDFFGEKRYTTILKHYAKYPKGFKYCKGLRMSLLKTRSFQEAQKVIENFTKQTNFVSGRK